jgi:hypothetical protein
MAPVQEARGPSNITLMPLPAKAPELNPVENVWQFLRENWLSNRIFTSYSDILDHCCEAWNKLTDQPGASCPSAARLGARVLIIGTWYKHPWRDAGSSSGEEPAQIQHNALGAGTELRFDGCLHTPTSVSLGSTGAGSRCGDGFHLGVPSSPRICPLSGFAGSWVLGCGLRRRGSPVRSRRHQIGVGREGKEPWFLFSRRPVV